MEEGTSITADGIIVHSNNFSLDESILTGESLPVFKDSPVNYKINLTLLREFVKNNIPAFI